MSRGSIQQRGLPKVNSRSKLGFFFGHNIKLVSAPPERDSWLDELTSDIILS